MPKANYAFRKKNFKEKKCLDQLGKKFPFQGNQGKETEKICQASPTFFEEFLGWLFDVLQIIQKPPHCLTF